MVKCLKCGGEYSVEEIQREQVVENKKWKLKFYRLTCKKCGHVVRIQRTDPDAKFDDVFLKEMGFDKPDEILTEEEYARFKRRGIEADYRIDDTNLKRFSRRIKKKLDDSELTDEEEKIKKEELIQQYAAIMLARRERAKYRKAAEFPKEKREQIRKNAIENIKKIQKGDFDPDDLKDEMKAISKEIDKQGAEEDTQEDLQLDIERKRRKAEDDLKVPQVFSKSEKDFFTHEDRKKFDLADRHKKDAHWTEQRDAWINFYNQEMENLRTALRKGDIEDNQFERETRSLKNYVNKKLGKDIGLRGKWSWRMKRATSSKYGTHLLQVAQVLALSIVGVVATASFNSLWFFFGFLSIGLYFMIPNPSDYEPRKDQKINMMSWLPVGQKSRSTHNTTAFLRSFAKVAAIICFAYAFKDLGDVFNIFYIGIAIFGYFLLKVEYDPDVPAEFIESVFRFFIGIFFIPTIFVTIFDSWVLGAIALAFFAVPPLPAAENKNIAVVLSRGLSGATAYYEIADKFIFGALMLFALIGSGALPGVDLGASWQLTGALQNTFLYFWIVTGVAGFFSPAKERPVTGAIMLGAATIIYGIGPGSQAVGSGLLGDWWPTVHNTFTDVTEPLANVMGSLGNTFGQGFMLLTNPVGYATQLMNGSYTSSGTGPIGSYGVDITSLSVSPVLPVQPFVVTAILENKGAFDAKNVEMSLQALSDDKYGTSGTARTSNNINLDMIMGTSKFKIIDLGFNEGCIYGIDRVEDSKAIGELKECKKYYNDNRANEFSKMLVWQAAFQSTGIPCSTITLYDIRKKFIPLYITTSYDYQSDSRVQVEFISKAEWDRKAQAGELDQGFSLIESQYTSAPVKFPIGTAGLKNPILETQQFHISMSLASAFDRDSQIDDIKKVNLTFPKEWEFANPSSKCTPPPDDNKIVGDMEYVEWTENIGAGSKTFACYFKALGQGAIAAPTKSYIVTAHADYRFSRWKIKDTKIEFGGFCCPDKISTDNCEAAVTEGSFWEKVKAYVDTGYCSSEDCLDNQLCVSNACVYAQESGGDVSPTDLGGTKYCETRGKCEYGEGHCTNNSQCVEGDKAPIGYGSPACKDITGLDIDICCPSLASSVECIHAYNMRKEGKGTAYIVDNVFQSPPGGTETIKEPDGTENIDDGSGLETIG